MGQVTQKDIARALNVSRVTVNKALKDYPDIGVIGFGDVEFAKLFMPPLTSVHMPVKEIAEKAVVMLIQAIDRPDEHCERHEIVKAYLKIRGSIRNKSA